MRLRLAAVGSVLLASALTCACTAGRPADAPVSGSVADSSADPTAASSPAAGSTATGVTGSGAVGSGATGGSAPTSAASVTPEPATSTPVHVASAPGTPACTVDGLRVEIDPGSGASGVEFASIVLTNVGSAACTLTGYPTVQLLLGGRTLVASASTAANPAPGTVTLARGQAATSLIRDFSSCNAANSDTARVGLPGRSATVDVPQELRGCRVQVESFQPA